MTSDLRRRRLRAIRHWLVAVVAMDLVAVLALAGLPALDDPARAILARAAVVAPEPDERDRTPVALAVGDIAVEAPVIPLGLEDDGTLEVPDTREDAGWWSGGAAPGAPGPTVIVGHVNLRSGPAVFARLSELAPGDLITVALADGGRAEYRVTQREQVAKEAFPTERVYGPTATSELRLVTCGGSFRLDDRSYTDNVIVYATMVRELPPPAAT